MRVAYGSPAEGIVVGILGGLTMTRAGTLRRRALLYGRLCLSAGAPSAVLLTLLGAAQANAQAQACGAPDANGNVVCAPTTYPAGISYTVPAPLTVLLQQNGAASVTTTTGGVQLTTSGTAQTTLARSLAGPAGGPGPVLVNGAGDAVSVQSSGGPVTVDLRDPGGAGAALTLNGSANGVTAVAGGTGGATVLLGAGTVSARTGSGVQATAPGAVTVDTGTVAITAAVDGVAVQQIGATGAVSVTTGGPISAPAGQSGDAGVSVGAGNTANTDPIQVIANGAIFNETGGVRVISRGSRDVTVTTGAAASILASQDGINVSTAGTGTITVSTGASVTGDTNSGTVGNALTLATDAGAINVTTAAGTTLSTNLGPYDVLATSNTGAITVANAATLAGVNATGLSATTGSGAITLTSTGAMGSAAQAIRQGLAASITGGSGALAVTTSADIFASGPVAINVANAGSGASNVTVAGGTVTALNGDGLRLFGGTGASAVAVAAGAAISGNTGVAVSGSGGLTVSNAGTITGNMSGAGVQLSPNGTSDATLANAAGGVIQGAGDTTVDPSILLGGSGSLDVENSGTIRTTALADHLGVAFVGGGTGPATIDNAASGVFDGRIVVGGGGANFINAGMWSTNGLNVFAPAGAAGRTLTNSGTLQVGATAGVAASQTIFTGLGSTLNSGVISLANGFAGDNLSLSGTYAGSGAGRLVLDIAPLAGAARADTLTIAGAATGATTVTLVPLAPLGFTTGTLLVQAQTGSVANAFTLAPDSVNVGLTRNAIVYNAATGGYFLVSSPNAAAAELTQFSEIRHTLWFVTGDAVSSHLSQLRDAEGLPADRVPTGLYSWGQALGGAHDRSLTQTLDVGGAGFAFNQGYEQTYEGAQVGLELTEQLFHGSATAGVTAGYVDSRASFDATGDTLDLHQFNLGAYAAYDTPLFFLNGLLKFDLGSQEDDSGSGGFRRSLDTRQFGVLVEAGHRFDFRGWFVEPRASASYVHGYLAGGDTVGGPGGDEHQNVLDLFGASVIFPDDNSARARFDVRVGTDALHIAGRIVRPYVEVGAVGEFAGGDKVLFAFPTSALSLPNAGPRAFGTARVGAETWLGRNLVLTAQATGEFGGGVTGGGGILSAAYHW